MFSRELADGVQDFRSFVAAIASDPPPEVVAHTIIMDALRTGALHKDCPSYPFEAAVSITV
ncbi:uncharacterized protein PHALS_00172 [Plasmopara halstedii]|uniref:Uncharacterized protein n=1 Tax=Plasmopara halstedii TaxID=4781 RepID=A0A0N7L3G9_PLAHL|nr:uncharacterized protein PHALS_00172 [Plasmopara halstedii]CEG35843.1 hypothetical protein PHALS_00172 [Plasmopara halstedii]|eukprot:XP_024572212.1 hypothetical protein PHALS_00172 [Plasmopara halstedii]